jgi:hypothetical protein
MDEFEPYRKQINSALRELARLEEFRRKAGTEISKLRALIVANANMLPDRERGAFILQASEPLPGLTDTIREFFRAAYPKGLTPKKLRDKLIEAGFDLNAQSNPMASVHSVIRRLCLRDEIERHGDVDIGGFRWKPREGYVPPPPSIDDLTKGKR